MRPLHALLPLSLLLAPACAPAAPPATAPAPATVEATAAFVAPKEIRWVRGSAEHRAAFLQTYRAAGERLRALAEGREPGTWAVVLDADETVLDNSLYQLERAQVDSAFSLPSWQAWVRRGEAEALPGAVEFTSLARNLGGRVAIVTNRDDVVCAPTRENLLRVGIAADVVLCQPSEGDRSKDARFERVRTGAASPELPPLEVLMWLGDNIQDFPGMTQDARTAPEATLQRFGRDWFVLPNPMYGSWERGG